MTQGRKTPYRRDDLLLLVALWKLSIGCQSNAFPLGKANAGQV
jgi:hypothetical protein